MEYELKYTYNSFKYMEEFDLNEIAELENKPFRMIGTTEELLLGALNHNPKVEFGKEEIGEYIESVLEEGNIMELLEQLMELLQTSSFFKSLQKTPTKKSKK